MKTLHLCFISFIVYFATVSVASAQKNTVSSGGDISGSGGSVSYSIGQIDHLSKAAATGNITEGVQQPYEIYVVTGAANVAVVLGMTAYPNPTADQLTLQIESNLFTSLTYSLYDVSSKLIEEKKISSSSIDITMRELPAGVYFLKVFNNSNELKVFKIIKY